MGIFIKRPLCLFCFCFIGASLLSSVLSHVFWLPTLPAFAFLSIVFLLLSLYLKKIKYGLIEASVAMACVTLAFIVSFFTIYIPKKNSQKIMGEAKISEFLILEEEYSSKYSTKYSGKLLSSEGKKSNLSAYLLLDHEADYKSGDVLYLICDITSAEKDNIESLYNVDNISIILEQAIDKDAIICDEYNKFHPLVFSARIRSIISDFLYNKLGTPSSALSIGLLTGDTSLLPIETVRDFRRAGLSHVLAVSGLHLAVIIGALDFLLKKIYVRKGIRCVLFSFIALFILFFSGFSASALRSVLMLLLAYLSFALSREPDALTSLSLAGALILFIPGSATSVSFWLSFLSTLGLVSWYSVLSALFERSSKKDRRGKLFIKATKKLFAAISVTLVANVSICFVLWLVFGEISIIAAATNLIITPLCSLYLIMTLLVFILGAIPYVCEIFAFLMSLLCDLIGSLAAFFAHFDISVLSLKYSFTGIIIILSTLSLLVLLIVKLKRKIFVLVPPVAATVCFCVCLAVYNITATHTNVIYTSTEGGDILTFTDRSYATLIDASNGSYATIRNAYNEARDLYVTDIERVILTDYYEKHISTLDSFMREAMVRTLYLPEPTDERTLLIATDILRSAESLGVKTVIYKKGTLTELDGKADFLFTAVGDRSDLTLSVSNENGSLIYTDSLSGDSDNTELKKLLCERCDILVLGERKPISATALKLPSKIVIPADTTLPALSEQSDGTQLLIAKENKKDERIRGCVFKLEE